MQSSKITLGIIVVNNDSWKISQVYDTRIVKGITTRVKSQIDRFSIVRVKDGLSICLNGEASLYHFNLRKPEIINVIKEKY